MYSWLARRITRQSVCTFFFLFPFQLWRLSLFVAPVIYHIVITTTATTTISITTIITTLTASHTNTHPSFKHPYTHTRETWESRYEIPTVHQARDKAAVDHLGLLRGNVFACVFGHHHWGLLLKKLPQPQVRKAKRHCQTQVLPSWAEFGVKLLPAFLGFH